MWTPWGRQRSGHWPSPAGSLSECCSCRCGHVPMKSCRDCLRILMVHIAQCHSWTAVEVWLFLMRGMVIFGIWVSFFFEQHTINKATCPMTSRTGQQTSWSEPQSTKWFAVSSFATIAQPLCHRARRNFGHLSEVNLARSLSLLSELVPMRRSIGQCRRRRHWCSQEGCQQKHNLWRWWPTLRKIDGRKLNLQRVWCLKEVQWSLKLVNTFCAWFVSY